MSDRTDPDLLDFIAYDDPGIAAIGLERRRVLDNPHRSVEHDITEHAHGEFVDAAICYLLGHGYEDQEGVFTVPARWPWDAEDFNPGNTGDPVADRRRDLVRAGQFVAAEITRMDVATYRLPLDGETPGG